ncbi:hypothetical protein [Synechocystis sp. LKSZ1]|uniref:hypothetical protein n=1 Tax=Synechocystis sp. LKSZ1 TaxID=3144951 RepID=UPI00336C0E5E
MISFLTFLLGVALTKGLLEPFLAKWTKRGIIKYVPPVLNRLDQVMPKWIAIYDEPELRAKVENIIYEETSHYEAITPRKAQLILEEVVSQYSFLVNAGKYGEVA